jgi:protein-S-isoprenylcysteine O-methyltransferase Ste14
MSQSAVVEHLLTLAVILGVAAPSTQTHSHASIIIGTAVAVSAIWAATLTVWRRRQKQVHPFPSTRKEE